MRHLLTFGLLALVAAVAPAQAGTFLLSAVPTVNVGGVFDVTLTLSDPFDTYPGDAIASAGFNVDIVDPSVVSYTGFTPGSLFFDATFATVPTVLVIANDPAGLSTTSIGYTDPVEIAVLHFTALQVGSTTISVSTDAANDLNQGLYYVLAGAQVDFTASTGAGVSAVPEPGTFAGCALGACMLALVLRRRTTARL